MTYIAHLDPEAATYWQDAAEALDEEFREAYGDDWAENTREPEARTLVPENEVSDPDVPIYWRYGADDPGRWIPGSQGE